MPQCGVIKGGQLDGWRFHFLYFIATAAELQVLARVTPPAWPFPRDIALQPRHFMQLRAVPGERAKKLDADALIASAYTLEKLSVPEWLLERSMTLRATVKRAETRRRA